MRAALIALVVLALGSSPAVAHGLTLERADELAQAYWGAPPPCGAVRYQIIPHAEIKAAARAWPERCEITVSAERFSDGGLALCSTIAHEHGHLHGLFHNVYDYYSLMSPFVRVDTAACLSERQRQLRPLLRARAVYRRCRRTTTRTCPYKGRRVRLTKARRREWVRPPYLWRGGVAAAPSLCNPMYKSEQSACRSG